MFTRYNVSPIAIVLLIAYVLSFVLYKKGRIKITTHRKIWNVLLLVTFLTTGLFGLILAIRRDYALLFSFPVNLLFWHVEAGVVMTVVSIFHLSWHLNYYRELLRGGREKLNAARCCESDQKTDSQERIPAAGSLPACGDPALRTGSR
jgi:hypothetical protein